MIALELFLYIAECIQGTTLVIGAVYVAANLLADLVHGYLNPRIGKP